MNNVVRYPLVSVIMNCYNGEKYLRQAIDSVLAQTYYNWEIIFYDNFSTDESANIFHSYSDPRFYYYRSTRFMPLYEARNWAIGKARGSFIAFLDVDDLWIPRKLELQLDTFKDPKVGMSCGNFYFLNEREKDYPIDTVHKSLPQGKVLNELLSKYFVHMSSLMLKREALDSLTHYFNPNYTIMGDVDLVLRMNQKWDLSSVQEPITYYRYHENNTGNVLGFLYSLESDSLIENLKINNEIYSLPGFRIFSQRVYWFRVLRLLYEGKKKDIFPFISFLSNYNKIKALLAFFLPNTLIKKRIEERSKYA